MYPHDTYCPTDQARPEPVGFCDFCNKKRYLKDLQWEMAWTGPSLLNTRMLVCPDTCLDVPNEQFRMVRVGPDPAPLRDPRPGFQLQQMGQGFLLGGGWGTGDWSGGVWSVGNAQNYDFVE